MGRRAFSAGILLLLALAVLSGRDVSASGLGRSLKSGEDKCKNVVCEKKLCHESYCKDGECVYYACAKGTDCDDGDKCTKNDKCDGYGKCEGKPIECEKKLCQDAYCEDGYCKYKPCPKDTDCDDNDKCTTWDKCDGYGKCVGKPIECEKKQCYDAYCKDGKCQYKPSAKDTDCDDYDACTEYDKCDGYGKCKGKPKECEKKQCYDAYCADGKCEYKPSKKDTYCDDGDKCTEYDKCDGYGSCKGKPIECEKKQCFDAYCKDGKCEYKPCAKDTECDDNDKCTIYDMCDGEGKCVGKPIECEKKQCYDAFCKNGKCQYKASDKDTECDDYDKCTKDDKCDGYGKCKGKPIECEQKQCYDAYCKEGQCEYKPSKKGTSCDDYDKCTLFDVCDGYGKCVGKPIECEKKQCYDAYCKDGKCEYKASEKDTYCDDYDKCTKDDKCDGEGSCKGKPIECEKKQCYDAYCKDGKCQYMPSAQDTECDDNNKCTEYDKCDGYGKCKGKPKECEKKLCMDAYCKDGSCEYTPTKKGSYCDDYDKCTEYDKCDGAGSCVGKPIQCEKKLCMDAYCKDGECQYKPSEKDTPCNDYDKCTKDDKCDGYGKCIGKPIECAKKECFDSYCEDGKCQYKPCEKDTYCDDKDKCTKEDKCDGYGKCVGKPIECEPKMCYDAYCKDGECQYKPCKKDTYCDDYDKCTEYDKCDGYGTCKGKPIECEKKQCFDAYCKDGKCEYKPCDKDTECNDYDKCTKDDKCDGYGKCVGKPIECEKKLCMDAYCKDGKCQYMPSAKGTECDDYDKCTKDDKCDGEGKCKGKPIECEKKQCYDAYCKDGGCEYKPAKKNTECDDYDKCTKDDKCDGYGSCKGKPIECEKKQCYDAYCKDGECEYKPCAKDTYCDDNDKCTKYDVCDGYGKCVGKPIECEKKMCYDAYCKDGKCEYKPCEKDSYCDDYDKCTEYDKCDGYGKCKGKPIECEKKQCYDAYCKDGKCEFMPSKKGTDCDDGNKCTKDDKCDGYGKCVGKPKECKAHKECADGQCKPESGKCCYYKIQGKKCNNGEHDQEMEWEEDE